ncbi:hypothetical protein ACTXT7_016170 [Hymenolepis weldensis]
MQASAPEMVNGVMKMERKIYKPPITKGALSDAYLVCMFDKRAVFKIQRRSGQLQKCNGLSPALHNTSVMSRRWCPDMTIDTV